MKELLINKENIQNKIYNIRGIFVMLDRDLAELYQVETRRINEQVKRNIERFPEDFMFQLTKDELEIWKSQNATSNSIKMGLRKMPLAFTEQGVYMLSIEKYNSQYNNLQIKISNKFHDRFLIIDNQEAYHIGASLKDLGKKIFGFNKFDIKLLNNFKNEIN